MRMQGNGMRFLGVGKINLKMKSIWKKSRGRGRGGGGGGCRGSEVDFISFIWCDE
jgi:hypothetical protein